MSTTVRTTTSPATEHYAEPGARIAEISELVGRVFLSTVFLVSGIGKISGYAATAGYMDAVGVPSALLPIVIAAELLGAVALIAGWKTRITAFLLAGFTLLTAVIFHSNLSDQTELVMFLKNVSIAGGLLLLVAQGAGRLSLDRRAAKSSGESHA